MELVDTGQNLKHTIQQIEFGMLMGMVYMVELVMMEMLLVLDL